MIIVTGATGQLGRQIVLDLVKRVPAGRVGVSVREPAKAEALAALGVRVRRGDFADVASLAAAFEGATQVLMVSSNARAYGGDSLAQHANAIEAARAAGARRIVYTSHMASSASSLFPPMHDHAATEALLAGSGFAWTALRNGFYASSAVMFMGDGPVVEAPADGKVSWTTHADLAAAAAAVLADEGRFDGPTPPLIAAEALDFSDLATLAGKSRETISEDAVKAKIAARGLPPVVADITLGMYRAARAGEFAAVDPTLEKLIGRPPIAMRDVLAAKRGQATTRME